MSDKLTASFYSNQQNYTQQMKRVILCTDVEWTANSLKCRYKSSLRIVKYSLGLRVARSD